MLTCCLYMLSLQGYAQLREPTDTYYQTGKVQPIMANYEADRGNLSRFYVIAGSPERRERFQTFIQGYVKQLQQVDFDKMTASDKVDYILFKRTLDNELRVLNEEEKEYEQIRKYIPFGEPIYQTEKLRRRGTVLEAQQLAQTMTSIDAQVKQLIKSVQAEEISGKPLLQRAEISVRGLQSAVKSVYDFYNGYEPGFTWWLAQPFRHLDSSLNAYANVFRAKASKSETGKNDGSGIVGNPIGERRTASPVTVRDDPL